MSLEVVCSIVLQAIIGQPSLIQPLAVALRSVPVGTLELTVLKDVKWVVLRMSTQIPSSEYAFKTVLLDLIITSILL